MHLATQNRGLISIR